MGTPGDFELSWRIEIKEQWPNPANLYCLGSGSWELPTAYKRIQNVSNRTTSNGNERPLENSD